LEVVAGAEAEEGGARERRPVGAIVARGELDFGEAAGGEGQADPLVWRG